MDQALMKPFGPDPEHNGRRRPRRMTFAALGLILLVTAIVAAWAPAAPSAAAVAPCEAEGLPPLPSIRLKPVLKGLRNPLALVNAGDGSGRLFIVEQQGIVKILKAGRLVRKPFLDLRGRVISGGEMGLLGLAFHPRFSENGRLFVNYTSRSNGLHTVVSEIRVGSDPDAADRNTESVLLTIRQPFTNHNGGQIAFGPDGYLYIATGDGGAANDPGGNAQNLSSLLGKILRIDVDSKGPDTPYGIPSDNPFLGNPAARREVWAFGLRNPWRFSFDPVSGFLYAGDVGQDTREEIDVIQGGKNFGWNIMEGRICTPGVDLNCDKTGLEPPIWDYPRPEGTVVIGGRVYRGRSIPNLCGIYVFGDFGNGSIFGLQYEGGAVVQEKKLLSTRYGIAAFGEDENHELYVVDHGGKILLIVPSSTSP
jgi:glucose/arabinose dehydrogenase